MADAGAEVIKIERPEGDFARGYDAAAKGQSSYFVWLNRGKQSAVVDLATKEGRAELEALIASADVLLQNLKPGSMDKLGFSLERLLLLLICLDRDVEIRIKKKPRTREHASLVVKCA